MIYTEIKTTLHRTYTPRFLSLLTEAIAFLVTLPFILNKYIKHCNLTLYIEQIYKKNGLLNVIEVIISFYIET